MIEIPQWSQKTIRNVNIEDSLKEHTSTTEKSKNVKVGHNEK